jgi:hypothetical protein
MFDTLWLLDENDELDDETLLDDADEDRDPVLKLIANSASTIQSSESGVSTSIKEFRTVNLGCPVFFSLFTFAAATKPFTYLYAASLPPSAIV